MAEYNTLKKGHGCRTRQCYLQFVENESSNDRLKAWRTLWKLAKFKSIAPVNVNAVSLWELYSDLERKCVR